jgi:hypothetical protein
VIKTLESAGFEIARSTQKVSVLKTLMAAEYTIKRQNI